MLRVGPSDGTAPHGEDALDRLEVQGVLGLNGAWHPLPDRGIQCAPAEPAVSQGVWSLDMEVGRFRPQALGIDGDWCPPPALPFQGYDHDIGGYRAALEDVAPHEWSTVSASGFEGDPYPKQKDVYRGLTLPESPRGTLHTKCSDGEHFWCGSSQWDLPEFQPGFELAPTVWEACATGAGEAGVVEGDVDSPSEPTAMLNGQASLCPPPIPDDENFQLESSTFRVSGCKPHSILEELLEFFDVWLEDARVEKKNYRKFSVKAVVCLDGFRCSLKVRVYTEDTCNAEGLVTYAIEFQRRDGNALAFRKVFAAAESRVKPRLSEGAEFGATPHAKALFRETPAQNLPGGRIRILPPLSANNSGAGGAKEVHQVVLEMAQALQSPTSQLEAAGKMLALAQEGPTGVQALASDAAVEAVKALVQSDDADVNFLTASLLLHLARCPQMNWRLASQAVLPILDDKFRSDATSPVVQKMLGQVLEAVHAADGRAVFQP